jgi:hypothetical protein
MKLEMTCYACPEQYKLFDGPIYVGYLRLRHGNFTATYVPDDSVVYSADTIGDGSFDGGERDFHLANALEAIQAKIVDENRAEQTNAQRLIELLQWNSKE